ncbi:MAG: DNA primase [Prevotella ruminicola]|jgi:DNA primase|uniref:DNA primase n=1 Tax=Xylanibacter ruminicola TaxID=839 RepID=A0A928BQJ6_XYLRU|nr:DNA primase [Xylanibacter ruminicola]
MIDRETIDKILDATNIVDVVSEFVTLRKSGVNYKGLCPFHDDKTPSFMVSPTKQICKCFSCGEGGTAINFLMKHEQITYPEALRWLAKKYNIEIQEKELTDEERQEQSDRESMFIVNEWAMNYFKDVLNHDPDGVAIGRQYFRSRGIRDDIVEKFNLGFSLSKRDALDLAAKKAGYKEEFLIKTGLCIKGEKGVYDRYAGRVIFPWFNVSGKVVAFGGRLLDARTKGVQQKYVNSPDSEIYHKERELYGLYQGKKAIAKEDCVYMVEGYTDVIAMHQCGLENVVANSGTALSKYQIKLLRRFTPNIILLYDGDEAGIHAAMRGTDMLLAEGMKVKVLLLPDGDDPDSFSRKHTAAEFKAYIEEHAEDFIEFKTKLTVENVSDPVKRSEAIGGIVKSISVVDDQLLRDEYLTQLSRRLGIKEETLLNSMNGMISHDREEKEKEYSREQAQEAIQREKEGKPMAIGLHTTNEQISQLEEMLMKAIVRDGEKVMYENVATADGGTINLSVAQFIDYDLGSDGLSFSNPVYNKILQEVVAHIGEEDFKAEEYLMRHPDYEVSSVAAHLAVDPYQLSKSFQMKEREGGLRQHVEHLVLDFRYYCLKEKVEELKAALKNCKDDYMSIMQELARVDRIYKELAKKLGR